MIGQANLRKTLSDLLSVNKFPRFSIFVGDVGSGRKTIIQDVLKPLGTCQICSTDVESVRNVIEQAYTTIAPIMYVFSDADNMSLAAKNALLKVTEEPPNNAYFILTAVNLDTMLGTIVSRARVFSMDSYTTNELLEFYHDLSVGGDENIVSQYCSVPGDVLLLLTYRPKEFKSFVEMVVDNVEKVSGANSFKIGQRLNLANTEDKYDLGLFLKAFVAECMLRLKADEKVSQNGLKYALGAITTNTHLYELKVAGINKQMLFDDWLLAVRKAWM